MALKFKEHFAEPVLMQDDNYRYLLLDGSLPREEAERLFALNLFEKTVDDKRISRGYTRFGFSPYSAADKNPQWWFDCGPGKGAFEVWIYSRDRDTE